MGGEGSSIPNLAHCPLLGSRWVWGPPNDCPDIGHWILAYVLQDKGGWGICQYGARLLRPNHGPQLYTLPGCEMCPFHSLRAGYPVLFDLSPLASLVTDRNWEGVWEALGQAL